MDEPDQNPCQAFCRPVRTFFCLAGAAWLLLCGGCATPEMKGTPFYTGDAEKRTGPVENRINGWPLLYYREPSLSVLWPIFEFTDDHTAVRPLFSVYGLDRPDREYNVLWPLAQFDRHTGDHRIVPVFWGDDYTIVAPLYWHMGHPWGEEGGTDTLFPLWLLNRHGPEKFSFYAPWPLGHWWADQKKNQSGSMVFPLYYHGRDGDSSQFYSLLWLDDTKAPNDYWRSALPPLTLWWVSPKSQNRGSMVLPFYLRNRDAEGSLFFSLLWVNSTSENGDYRRAVLPLVYWWNDVGDHESGSLVLPFYLHSRRGDSSTFFSPLWMDLKEKNVGRWRAVLPVAFWWENEPRQSAGSLVLPFYLKYRDPNSSQFLSPLWMSGTDEGGGSWSLLFPLYFQAVGTNSSVTATLFWAQGRSPESDWQTVIPLAYWDRRQGTMISPLWAHWRNNDANIGLAPWALTWWIGQANRTDLWMLGGLGRASWGQNPGVQYFIPVFYRNPARQTLVTPLWAQWKNGGQKTSLLPWTLSWWNTRTNGTDLWMLGALARASWGEKPGWHYVFPLYYRDAADKTFLTPLFGWRGGDDGFFYPLTPIAGVYHSPKREGSWFIPLYWHWRDQRTGDTDNRWLLMLGGNRTEGRHKSSWFIPLYYSRNDGPLDSVPEKGVRQATYGSTFWCLPFNWSKNQCRVTVETAPTNAVSGTDLSTNVVVKREYIRKQGIFPLWTYSARTTPAQNKTLVKSTVPVLFYAYRHEVEPLKDQPGGTNDYTRASVLWRAWHYERLNGDVSVDCFPAITYDRKTDGFKKTSFLWRCYRYERAADGSKKLDLLFIPLMRSGPAQ
jgi:hypothetical protein